MKKYVYALLAATIFTAGCAASAEGSAETAAPESASAVSAGYDSMYEYPYDQADTREEEVTANVNGTDYTFLFRESFYAHTDIVNGAELLSVTPSDDSVTITEFDVEKLTSHFAFEDDGVTVTASGILKGEKDGTAFEEPFKVPLYELPAENCKSIPLEIEGHDFVLCTGLRESDTDLPEVAFIIFQTSEEGIHFNDFSRYLISWNQSEDTYHITGFFSWSDDAGKNYIGTVDTDINR